MREPEAGDARRNRLGEVDLVFEECDFPLPRRRSPTPRVSSVTCANCDETFVYRGPTPYCCDLCRSIAKSIRYVRGALHRYGGRPPEDVKYAIKMKIAHTLVGGYHEQARHLDANTRQAVGERDDGKCLLCHAPGEEIDHIDGDSNEPVNLRLLCKPCHREVTEARLVPIRGPEQIALLAEIRRRCEAPVPERPCDHEDWHRVWRRWIQSPVRADSGRALRGETG
jgi:5-methylcytosine-specific restriction endonuclease McrA